MDLKQRRFHDEIPDVESHNVIERKAHMHMKFFGRVLHVIMITGLLSLLLIVAIAGS
ncbi:MAG TPA: hypothetical protein VMJ33_10315 [Gallionella sp.]|nr:hypothetical protein [Gallionella sp.]